MKSKKKIKSLISLSLTNGKLDPQKIAVIAEMLSRRELSYYHKMLKKIRGEELVTVTTAVVPPEDFLSKLTRLFRGREIVFLKDLSIIGGLKVVLSDFIFDASLKGYLERLRKNYDPSINSGSY